MSTILVSTPAAIVWKIATIVLGGVWLRVCLFEHSSVIWAVWLSVFLDLVSEVSAILMGSPTGIVWEVTTVVLGGVWLGISFLKHGSIVWAVWFSVRLLFNAVKVKWLCKVPLTRVMVVNSVMSMMGIGVVVDDVVVHMEVSMVGDGSIMMVIMVDIMG